MNVFFNRTLWFINKLFESRPICCWHKRCFVCEIFGCIVAIKINCDDGENNLMEKIIVNMKRLKQGSSPSFLLLEKENFQKCEIKKPDWFVKTEKVFAWPKKVPLIESF